MGAECAAFAIAPDACVAVDVTHGDSPDAPKEKTYQLGGGPVIGLGPNCVRTLSQALEESARRQNIPYQQEVMTGHTGTNAWGVQVRRGGIATAVLSLPLRYMHTPVEVLDTEDLKRLAQVLSGFVGQIGKEGAV